MSVLQEKHAALTREVSQLKQKLEIEIKVKRKLPVMLIHLNACLVPVTDYAVCFPSLQNEMTLAKAFEKARAEKKQLQEEKTKSQTELSKLRGKLAEIEAELQSTKQE